LLFCQQEKVSSVATKNHKSPGAGGSGGVPGDKLVEKPTEPRRRIYLAGALLFVAALRVGLYVLAHETTAFTTDFDLLYHSAVTLADGTNPYRSTPDHLRYPLFYPLPAVLVAMPFTALPIALARPAFDIAVGWIFAYALWRQASYALLALFSGAYIFAMRAGQTTPLVVAASLIPALGFLLTVKPNTGLACWIARPSRPAVIGGVGLLALTLVLLPSWPLDWWAAIQDQSQHIRPPILRPFGWLLLLAAFRWRTSGGQLLLALAIIPQNILPHELVPLVLIPGNAVEMAVYVVGSWVAVALTSGAQEQATSLTGLVAEVWPVLLLSVYVPMLYLVLRRPR
jgi:hypothetical protein